MSLSAQAVVWNMTAGPMSGIFAAPPVLPAPKGLKALKARRVFKVFKAPKGPKGH